MGVLGKRDRRRKRSTLQRSSQERPDLTSSNVRASTSAKLTTRPTRSKSPFISYRKSNKKKAVDQLHLDDPPDLLKEGFYSDSLFDHSSQQKWSDPTAGSSVSTPNQGLWFGVWVIGAVIAMLCALQSAQLNPTYAVLSGAACLFQSHLIYVHFCRWYKAKIITQPDSRHRKAKAVEGRHQKTPRGES
jgi:hypothetical protein